MVCRSRCLPRTVSSGSGRLHTCLYLPNNYFSYVVGHVFDVTVQGNFHASSMTYFSYLCDRVGSAPGQDTSYSVPVVDRGMDCKWNRLQLLSPRSVGLPM